MDTTRKIAVVRGAPGAVVQELFRSLATGWQPSVRLAGVLAEDHGLPDRFCSAGYLRSLTDDERWPIFQDLGPGTDACHLTGDGAALAASAVRKDIAAGCDLVILSKFGKLEAAGGGLRDAFCAAIETGVPVLTTVGRPQADAWRALAGGLCVTLPAEADRIEEWWQSVRPGSGR
ncbi:MAG TPA: DUF2478 domain-containing protein [Reyranella sp.]|nr:DUF2478 domain-containing protein [Reyranella sp.]